MISARIIGSWGVFKTTFEQWRVDAPRACVMFMHCELRMTSESEASDIIKSRNPKQDGISPFDSSLRILSSRNLLKANKMAGDAHGAEEFTGWQKTFNTVTSRGRLHFAYASIAFWSTIFLAVKFWPRKSKAISTAAK